MHCGSVLERGRETEFFFGVLKEEIRWKNFYPTPKKRYVSIQQSKSFSMYSSEDICVCRYVWHVVLTAEKCLILLYFLCVHEIT